MASSTQGDSYLTSGSQDEGSTDPTRGPKNMGSSTQGDSYLASGTQDEGSTDPTRAPKNMGSSTQGDSYLTSGTQNEASTTEVSDIAHSFANRLGLTRKERDEARIEELKRQEDLKQEVELLIRLESLGELPSRIKHTPIRAELLPYLPPRLKQYYGRSAGRGRGASIFGTQSQEDSDEELEEVEIAAQGKSMGVRPAGSETQGLCNLPCRKVRPTIWRENATRGIGIVAGGSGGAAGGRGGIVAEGNGGATGRGGGKKKMNGYLLFALSKKKQLERETGQKVDKSMDQVLRMFDEEWKNLSEEEKAEWKEKAKR